MGTKSRYRVQIHRSVVQDDLPDLPLILQEDFGQYQQVLALDPHRPYAIPNHSLRGRLSGCYALEIASEGMAYRLVYRIYETPPPRRVLILSFAEHDPAYERAIQRKK